MYLFLSPIRDPLQAFLVLGQHTHQSAVASRPIPVASVQAENVVGAAEVVDADVAVVPGFEVLLRLFADHGVTPSYQRLIGTGVGQLFGFRSCCNSPPVSISFVFHDHDRGQCRSYQLLFSSCLKMVGGVGIVFDFQPGIDYTLGILAMVCPSI